ncbi:MAG: hemerythrin HHE cation-binding protein [Cyanobacteria bacterium J06623_4]
MSNLTTIETKLADLQLFQTVLIEVEQDLKSATGDDTIEERLEKMIQQDLDNLSDIRDAVAKLGKDAEARDMTKAHAQKVKQMIDGSELTLFDKFTELELLKHQQTMTGLVLHKAAQSVSDELQSTMEPLNKVNFENRAHQEILKGILYFVGTRELAGKEPDMGLWASVEQGIAALKGAASSATSSS